MDEIVMNATTHSLAAMRAATREMAKGATFLTTTEAVEHCPFALSDETLLGYPEFVIPRFVKNPRAKRKAYLWDPRDIQALPSVLHRWQKAIAAGRENEFEEERAAELTARDLKSLRNAGLGEAA